MIPLKTPGSKLWRGEGIPSNSLGANGDDYQNIDNSDHYSKLAGVWILRGAINTALPLQYDQNTNIASIRTASSSQSGALSAADYSSFSAKDGVYYHYPVTGGVVENDIVMNIISNINGQAPLSFKLAVNGGDSYYPAIYGVAKNVGGGYADIWVGKGLIAPGFNFGVFIGVEYYIDPSAPGKLTWTPPVAGSSINPIKVGRALDATHLILDPIGNFVQAKGGIYTSDGTYDEVQLVGSNGNVLVANSAQANGLQWAPAVVTSAPLTYTTSTRALSIAVATNSIPGVMSAADHTLLSGAAPTASPTFTGTPSLPTGTTGVTQAANDSSTKLATTAFVTAADNLKANLASPTFSGTPSLPTGTIGVTQSAADSTTKLATTAFVTTADNLKANLASPVFTGDVNSSTGNVLVSTLGKGIQVKTGTNAKIGTVTLVAGTSTVANTSVTANSRIIVVSQTDGGTPGFLRVSAKTVGTSFVIKSSSATDTSIVAWYIVESIP